MRRRAAPEAGQVFPRIPELVLPPLAASADLAAAESAAVAYADAVSIEHPNLARRRAEVDLAAFDALAKRAGLLCGHIGHGRWSSHPPRPGVAEARSRVSARYAPPPVVPTAPF